jgi:flavin-binding protein dodecin
MCYHVLDKLRWFEVNEIRGAIDKDSIEQWQVGVTIAFTLNDD